MPNIILAPPNRGQTINCTVGGAKINSGTPLLTLLPKLDIRAVPITPIVPIRAVYSYAFSSLPIVECQPGEKVKRHWNTHPESGVMAFVMQGPGNLETVELMHD